MSILSKGALAAIIGLALTPALALAAEVRAGEQASLPVGTALTDDLYMAGGSVMNAGTVEGDFVAAGGTVLMSGEASEDVVAAGGTITILGEVGDDLRAGGGTITVESAVGDDVLIGGGQITIGGPGIGGDAIIGGGSVRIDAPIGGNVKVGGGEVYINAPIAGDVEMMADKVTLGPQARIEGSFSYSSPKEAIIEDGAVVVGETSYHPKVARSATKAGIIAFLSVAFFAKFIAFFLTALLFASFFKRYAHELVVRSEAQPWRYLGWGLVFMIVTPIVSIALLLTLVGIPLGIIGLLAFAASMIFAAMLPPIVIGSLVHKWIWKREEHTISWQTILLGTAIYFLLGLVPIIGGLVVCGSMLIVLGVAINIKKGVIDEWR